jgi:hypothetical protein
MKPIMPKTSPQLIISALASTLAMAALALQGPSIVASGDDQSSGLVDLSATVAIPSPGSILPALLPR